MQVYFELSGGQVHDTKHAPTLVVNLPDCQIVVADIDYDSDEFKDYIASLGYDSKIPRKLKKKR